MAAAVVATTTRRTLAVHDELFPIKIYFLDKSGSMGCNEFSKHALSLASVNAMDPEQGSNLVFFLAGTRETQAFYRRPGDPWPENFELEMGSATWFNEPVFLVSIDTPACEIYWGDLERWLVMPGPQGAGTGHRVARSARKQSAVALRVTFESHTQARAYFDRLLVMHKQVRPLAQTP